MKKLFQILILAGLAISSSFSFAETENGEIMKEYSPQLQIEHVIKKSKDYAVEQGRKIEDFFIQSVEYDSSNKEWNVFFMRKLPVPGNHFSIVIKDRTEKIELFLGK